MIGLSSRALSARRPRRLTHTDLLIGYDDKAARPFAHDFLLKDFFYAFQQTKAAWRAKPNQNDSMVRPRGEEPRV